MEKSKLIKSLSNYVCFWCFFDGKFLSLKRFHQKFINFFWFHSNYIHTNVQLFAAVFWPLPDKSRLISSSYLLIEFSFQSKNSCQYTHSANIYLMLKGIFFKIILQLEFFNFFGIHSSSLQIQPACIPRK